MNTPPPPAVPPARNRSPFLVVAVGVLGLLLGLGLGFAIFGSGDAEATSLDRACGTAEDLSDVDWTSDDRPSLQDPELWDLQAVGLLFAAAGYAADDEDLSDRGSEVTASVSRLALDDIDDLLGELRSDYC